MAEPSQPPPEVSVPASYPLPPADLLRQAAETLGDDSGKRWLHTPNRALGGQRPLDLLDTDLGSRQVEEVLGRIEHGIYG